MSYEVNNNEIALDAFEQAEYLFRNRQYKEAIKYYQIGLDSDVTNAIAWFKLGKCYYETEDYNAAIINLDSAISNNLNFTSAYNLKSDIYYRQKRYYEAALCAQKAVELYPIDESLWINYGQILNKLKRTQAAVACFEIGLLINPEFPEADIVQDKINRLIADLAPQGLYPLELKSSLPNIVKRCYPNFLVPQLPTPKQPTVDEKPPESGIMDMLRNWLFAKPTQRNDQSKQGAAPRSGW
jgi:tetratricopeptide (TPR) repeat protein